MAIVLDDVESDDAASKVDLSDFRAGSINQDADSFSPSPPCHHDPAKLSKTDVETEITEAENGHRPLKRKAGKTQRHNQSEC